MPKKVENVTCPKGHTYRSKIGKKGALRPCPHCPEFKEKAA